MGICHVPTYEGIYGVYGGSSHAPADVGINTICLTRPEGLYIYRL